MSEITDTDDQSTYRAVEDAFFGILWTLRTQRKADLVNLNILSTLGGMLLDFCHMLAFFVHTIGFGWGNITITWGTIVKYIQLQLPLYHYEGFSYAFWAAVAVTAIIVINAAIVGHSFWTKNFNQLWAIKMLHFQVAIFFNFVFIASFYLLVTPWWCDPVTNVLIPFAENGQDVSCFGWPNILALVLGTISIVILVFLVFTSTLATVDHEPVPNDLSAISSPSYRIIYNIALIFMTVNEYFLAKIIPETGHWWEALFNFLFVTFVFFVLIYYLPYQLQLGNELRGGMLGLLWWTAACSFVCVNLPHNENHDNRVIDYVLLAGMIPFAIFGSMIITQRYVVIKAFAQSLIDSIDSNFTPEETQKARFGTRKQDFIEGSDRNPDVYFPRSLQNFSTNLVTVEILGRTLWFQNDDKRAHEAAFKFYRQAEMAYPDVSYVKLLRATCLMALSEDSSLLKSQMDAVKNLNPTFSVRFQLYKREMEAKQKGSSNNSKNQDGGQSDDSLDLVAYVEFQKYYLEAQRYNSAAVDAIREFWLLFLQPTVTIAAFNNAARAIEAQTAKALATYKTLLIRYPKHVAILSSYGYFLELVMHNADEATKYHKRADEIRAREAEASNKLNIDGKSSEAAVIAINEEGMIEAVNKVLCEMFGYLRSEIIGRNIKSIISSPWKERHDVFMDRYRTTGEARVIGQPPRALFGQHKAGYSFALNLSIQEKRKENGDKNFVAMLVQTDLRTRDGVIIIKEDGTIVMISKLITEMFGFSANELIRSNVTVLMLDAYAANHESYLRRYKETGEARVIGTAGRNVPARRRNGTTFPISLTVTEETIGFENFYMANVKDTTDIKATIYMDGFGTIQNVDNGITILLGYHKEDVVGKNIKSIMPPPYNQYHDMYLERYRRTKISNILKSTEGRVLPAVHADGSIVQMRAIITRADNGDATGISSALLFKGLIQRVDNIGSNAIRPGFRDDDVIEINKNGIIKTINISVLVVLGYSQETDVTQFIGQSIELIFPPVNGRPMQSKENWIPKFLSGPDLNWYLLGLNKNYSLSPFTVNVSQKSGDCLIVRLRELLGLDALITIDEVGTIQAFNEDASLLLGHDQDEAMGQNIKFLLAPEIAVQHDSFLQRYKETRVARVVGIARAIVTIHRDKSVLPIEIQVAEVINGGISTYVGRLRHVAIEERIDREIIEKLMMIISKDEEIEEENLEDSVSKIFSGQGSKGGSKQASKAGSKAASQNLDKESEESSDSSSDSDSDESEDELADVDHQGVDAKLRYIKDSDAEDKSSLALGVALKYSLAIFAIVYVAALVVFNVLNSPIDYLIFMDQLIDSANVMSDTFAYTRQLQLQQYSTDLSAKYACSFDPKNSTGKACPFATIYDVPKELKKTDEHLGELSEWFISNYAKLIIKGDAIDKVYSSPKTYFDFTNADKDIPVPASVSTWIELFSSKFRPYVDKLAGETSLANEPSRISWNFIIYNRANLTYYVEELMDTVPVKIVSLLDNEIYIHLAFTLLLLALAGIVFLFVIGPRLRQINQDRILILKLVLLVPRPVIWEFVNVMYQQRSEDDEQGDEDAETQTIIGNNDKAKALKAKSDEVTEIIPEKRNINNIIFIAGLFSLSIPAIAHCAWKSTNNRGISTSLDQYLSTAKLYTGMYSFRWRELAIFATTCKAPGPDMTFCRSLADAKSSILSAANNYYDIYKNVQTHFAGNDEFSDILYRVSQIDPSTGKKFCPSAEIDPELEKSRCNDNYHGSDLPSDFSIKTSRGVGIYTDEILKGAWVLGQVYNETGIDPDNFWLMFASMPIEGDALLKQLTYQQQNDIEGVYTSARVASSVTYAISLAWCVLLFFWIFGTIRKNLQNESRHNRSILFMIPLDIVKKNKIILDYVDRVFLDLSS